VSDLAEGRTAAAGLASELSATREQLEVVLRNVAEGVTVIAPDGRFVYANEAAARLIGVPSAADLLTLDYEAARQPYDLFRADGTPLDPAELPGRRAFAGEDADDLLVRFRPAGGGEERVSIVRAVAVLDGNGRVQYVINFFREVTEERRSERRLRAQHAVTAALADAEEVDEALPRVLAAIAELLEWDVGAYWPIEAGADDARCELIHAGPGLESFAAATLGHRGRRDASLVGEIWRSGDARWIADLRDRDDFPQAAAAAATGIRSGFGFPALAENRVVGILEFFSRAAREPDAELLEVVRALGRNVGQFVERKRVEEERSLLLAAEQRTREEAEAAVATLRKLEVVWEAALRHLSLPRLLDALLARVVRVLDADTAAILLLDDGTQELKIRAEVGLDEELERAIPIPLGQGVAGKVAAAQAPLLIEDLDQIELVSPVLRDAGVKSLVAIPLVVEGRSIGVVHSGSKRPQHFSPDDVRLLGLIGDRIALSINQAALHEAEREAQERLTAIAVDNARLYREAAELAQAARVLASVGDGVLLVDRAGIARYWNRAAEAITGLPRTQIVDHPVAETIPAWQSLAGRVPIATEGATTTRAQSLPLAVGDRELWLSVSGVSVADGTVYAFRDLTDERALDELKTDFVSTVSHELRTPLAAIYGAAMTLRRGDIVLADDQRGGLLAVISNESDRLARIVNQILWAARLDTDSLSVAIESCDALELATEVVDAQRAHLPEGIEVELVAADALPPVAADPDKVRQVLVNLVDNAVKYSPDGGRVAVRIGAAGAHVVFAVADPGLGIPHAEQRRIFEKFYRLEPNMPRGIGGTGLGLYICRELVGRMHGRIWVESEPGRGSTFSFELPIAAAGA
jgi:PAS domain S-box-containing protein